MEKEKLAAPALLGSNVLAAAGVHQRNKPKPASSGSVVIDENALEGGYGYGEITSIAGSDAAAKTLLAYHAIASHLLNTSLGEVAVIDTTGAFSPFRLRDVLIFRLEAHYQRLGIQQSGYMYQRTPSKARDEIVDEATAILDRVKVMRVFDFAGVAEAVSEISEMREKSSRVHERTMAPDMALKSKEIEDSEEEVDDEDEGQHAFVDEGAVDPQQREKYDANDGHVGMLIIDTITNVVSSMMVKSQVQGQALVVSFMHSLRHLTSRYHICTILTNAAVGLNRPNNFNRHFEQDDNVSVFSSTLGKPALGKTFTYLIDTSIFLSSVPKTSEDAGIMLGVRGELSSYQKAYILEVLKDKSGVREGRWAAFKIVDEVKLVPCLS